jgi:hypothetical protein
LAHKVFAEFFQMVISSEEAFCPGISPRKTLPNVLEIALLMFLT